MDHRALGCFIDLVDKFTFLVPVDALCNKTKVHVVHRVAVTCRCISGLVTSTSSSFSVRSRHISQHMVLQNMCYLYNYFYSGCDSNSMVSFCCSTEDCNRLVRPSAIILLKVGTMFQIIMNVPGKFFGLQNLPITISVMQFH